MVQKSFIVLILESRKLSIIEENIKALKIENFSDKAWLQYSSRAIPYFVADLVNSELISYIYVDYFGLSEQTFSYFFAGNALLFVIGPLLYMRLSRYFKSNSIITGCYIATAISGLLIIFLGSRSPWLFAFSIAPASLCGSLIRPPATNLMIEQQKRDIGTAASLMSCISTIIGSIGMMIISFNWGNIVVTMGIMYAILSIVSIILWLLLHSKPFIIQVE